MTILLVDDERQVLDGIRHGVDFEALGLDEVLTARSGEEARQIIEKTRVDILITDIEMADLSGLELLEWIRDSGQKILTIFCTAFRSFDYAKKAIELHAFDYFLKPVRYGELTEKLAQATRALGVSQELPPYGARRAGRGAPRREQAGAERRPDGLRIHRRAPVGRADPDRPGGACVYEPRLPRFPL